MSEPARPSLPARLLRRAGRALEPLFAPDAESQRRRAERLVALAKEQDGAIRDLREQVTAERAELRRMRETRAEDVVETRGAIADLRSGVRRQGTALGRLVRSSGIHAELEWTEQRVVDRLSRIGRSGRPIVVGPWTGEIGFELLYWIPFVRWAIEKFNLPAERLVIVSRGGTRDWYAGLGARYVDTFSLVTPDEFRAATEAVKKQRAMGRFDRRLLRSIATGLAGGRPALLHPALMYALFMPFWKHQAALTRVADHARYRRIEPSRPASLPPLPAEYVAVRFYFSSCFPDTPGNRAFVAATVASLAEQGDVVMLNPGFRVDDHVDYHTGDGVSSRGKIHYVNMSAEPQENLAWQAAIIAGAKAFVGTYGGFAYLAPFCGVNALAFYSDRTYFVYHLELAQRAFAEVGGGTIEALDVGNVSLLRTALGGVQAHSSR
jgi:hypothetical protein